MRGKLDFDVAVVGGGPSGAIAALKCSLLGFKVALLEKTPFQSKPCGGLLTQKSLQALNKAVDGEIPESVFSRPSTLKVCYVYPDEGKSCIVDYEVLNVKRDLFDSWLREYASKRGVKVFGNTEFIKLANTQPVRILMKRRGKRLGLNVKYLVGADGVYSTVRRQLFPNIYFETAPAIQEHWEWKGEFESCFYIFFKRELTRAYAYIIPKDGTLIAGIWTPRENFKTLKARMELFKKLLKEKLSIEPNSVLKREIWAIPYQHVLEGLGNVVLVGDAGGFCNALTGEGISYAMESALAASESILEASNKDCEAVQVYREKVKEIAAFLKEKRETAISLTDEDCKSFVEFLEKRINDERESFHFDFEFKY